MIKRSPAPDFDRRSGLRGLSVPAGGLAGRARAARRLCAAAGVVLALAACERAGGERQSKVADGIRFDLIVASLPSQLSDGLADARPGSAAARPFRLLLKPSDAPPGDQRLIFSDTTPVHGVPPLAGFTYRLR